ncbi:MAG: hypothetical protein OR994_00040 [Candidatus Poseidoniales archaeon]|jgi:hypothetical protein|nr:hypothetical protein [Candidatus Poseidoniales archaeon]|tara:strand:- start:8787 stop:9212 length:426 start_codon:yes stop_codon:yes gene_type:complete
MTAIPATTLQQFIGMGDYERMLAIDRIARELGMTTADVEGEINDFEKGTSSPHSSPADIAIPERKSNFSKSAESQEGSPKFINDAHKYRFSYDPSRDAKDRQSKVNQAILCPHCNVAIGIPQIRPIKIMCPSCRIESLFEN